ncbi:hypothetical protein P691DRAFT_40311 [Macrolepiota fuliginosa MF-IS2]|uniref:Uncharacterized protein n=1 Tax=Macrolepiota fuliginosa MF-IS2 TaxID=1400762 RepID=A0A9P6C261_9AGAR|nr:hypothetical protein P691DRAFT_40311 [Macrolepiota fuliginosa MF-IS2]
MVGHHAPIRNLQATGYHFTTLVERTAFPAYQSVQAWEQDSLQSTRRCSLINHLSNANPDQTQTSPPPVQGPTQRPFNVFQNDGPPTIIIERVTLDRP